LQAVDWWSLGVVACQLLTGESPFTAGENNPREEVFA